MGPVDHPFRYSLLAVLLAAIIIGSLGFGGYLVDLDHEVEQRFADVRWVLPAQVYAAPVEIYPGARIDLSRLHRELDRLGYRSLPLLDGPGTYVADNAAMQIDLRPFKFWDGPQAEARIEVTAVGGVLTQVRDLESGQSRDLLRLDPTLIGSMYPSRGGEDRILVKVDEVPPLLIKALLGIEDRDFYAHHGISFRGMARALVTDVRNGKPTQGASTITQQLIRNLFLTRAQTFKRKLTEVFMSILLERHVSKDQILEAYLNEVWLGQDGARAIHGFGLASQFYFNKPLAELQPQEIAMLVGIVKGPSAYNPRKRPELVLERRNLVLRVLANDGAIGELDAQIAASKPLGLTVGGAVQYPAFIDLVKDQLKGQYKEEDLVEGGLRIFTTLNPHLQELLEQHMDEGLAQVEKTHRMKPDTLEGAGVVTSVEGGEVLAMVGGRDVRFAGFNRAIDSRRPIGSLVKPFLYLTALEHPDRYTLMTLLDGSPIAMKMPNGQIWSPENYDRQLHDQVPLYLALAHSYNVPTVHVGLDIGVDAVKKTLAAAGDEDAPALPSMFLGAVAASPLTVAQMYSTLAAGGFRTPLLAIREVQNQNGQPLQRYPFELRRVLPEAPLYLTTWAMQQVIDVGTGRWAASVLPAGQHFAGKTGTTEDLRDSWFAGFGADRVSVIWVGRDDNQPTGFDGAGGALRIWAPFMRDIDAAGLTTPAPPEVTEVPIDPATGLLADAGCATPLAIPYLGNSAPTQYAPCANASKSGPINWLKSLFDGDKHP